MKAEARKWTKEDYLYWLKHRDKDASQWKMADCRAADTLIRETTIRNFIQHVNFGKEPNRLVLAFTISMVKSCYGSAEVDELLTKLGCYPGWMEGGKK